MNNCSPDLALIVVIFLAGLASGAVSMIIHDAFRFRGEKYIDKRDKKW